MPWALEGALQDERLTLKIDEKMVAGGQDPKLIISRRKAIGGPSQKALQKHSESVSHQIQISHKWLTQKRKQQSLAKSKMVEMERNL